MSIDPGSNVLGITDRIALDQMPRSNLARFHLATDCTVRRVWSGDTTLEFAAGCGMLDVHLKPGSRIFTVEYNRISPTGEPRPSAQKGVLLTPAKCWHPHHADAYGDFTLSVQMPAHWQALGPGQLVARHPQGDLVCYTWRVHAPHAGAFLVAGPYARVDGTVEGLAASVLIPKDAPFSHEDILTATAETIRSLTTHLGPIPAKRIQLAVVDDTGGVGLPSTVIIPWQAATQKIQLRAVLARALAQTWSSTVLMMPSKGLWYEAVAEVGVDVCVCRDASDGATRRERLLTDWKREFGTVGAPPLGAVYSYEPTNDHGPVIYTKGGFVLSMLRTELGDETFFQGLREFFAGYAKKLAGWRDLQTSMEMTSRRDLDWFFTQWLSRRGAARLGFAGLGCTKTPTSYIVHGQVTQSGRPYALHVPVSVVTGKGMVSRSVWLDSQSERFVIEVDATPVEIILDPYFEVFRLPNPQTRVAFRQPARR